ncbi:MAG TPA: DPP IV N-terminal domain-containing protein, partial [Acidobacteriaceae bacterium]|nr:DPP IV N-terminal domain-containing protein [Acidobacteriaceae bacterium]
MQQRRVLQAACLIALIVVAGSSFAQVTEADFDRALNIQEKYSHLAVNLLEPPVWLESTDTFVYRKTVGGGHEFELVDAAAQTKQPAFDHAKLAAALSAASDESYKAATLPFPRFRFVDGRSAIEFMANGTRWHCDLTGYTCAKASSPRPGAEDEDDEGYDPTPRSLNDPHHTEASPDGQWLAYIENFNVHVRSKDGKQTLDLSTDGSEGNYYAFSTLAWSPDSKYLVAYRIRPGYHRVIRYVDPDPPNQLQPAYSTMAYPKPGDALAVPQPVLFDIAAKREIPIDSALFPNPYDLSDAKWWKDSRGFTFDYNQRGHQLYRVVEVDAHTGAARALITEQSSTFINYEPLVDNQYDTGKIYRHDVNDGKEIIWASERDGWEHLYLINGHTGEVENQITRGNWVVRAVNYVDDQKRQIWFEASGMNAGEDPYYVHGYRINFDGSGLTPLTPTEANHRLEFSPDGKYYVDLWSRIDLPPTMALFRTDDNKQLMQLEQADITRLTAAGWHPPEAFSAKGRDGVTD